MDALVIQIGFPTNFKARCPYLGYWTPQIWKLVDLGPRDDFRKGTFPDLAASLQSLLDSHPFRVWTAGSCQAPRVYEAFFNEFEDLKLVAHILHHWIHGHYQLVCLFFFFFRKCKQCRLFIYLLRLEGFSTEALDFWSCYVHLCPDSFLRPGARKTSRRTFAGDGSRRSLGPIATPGSVGCDVITNQWQLFFLGKDSSFSIQGSRTAGSLEEWGHAVSSFHFVVLIPQIGDFAGIQCIPGSWYVINLS